MPYAYLTLSVFAYASYSLFGKAFNLKCEGKKDVSALYNFILLSCVSLFWGIIFAFDRSFDPGVLIYSLLFAACFSICNVALINALKYGPVTLTSLFTGLSLVMTAIWGFFFWGAKVSVVSVVGLICVAVSIYLCLKRGKDEKSFSFKWLIFVVIAFISNAGCSIVQRTEQLEYLGRYGNEMMFFASLISTVAIFVFYIVSDKSDNKTILKKAWWAPVFAGISNVALNLLVLLMAITALTPTLIYPTIGVGGLILITAFSTLFFKEKLTKKQWCGFVVGLVAIALLSI